MLSTGGMISKEGPMKKLLTLAALGAVLGATAAQAQSGPQWEWTHPSNQHAFCRLFVQQVVQDNPDQRLRFTIRNDSNMRVRYTIAISAQGSAGRQSGTVSVDNANVNEVSVADSAQAFRGRVQRVSLTLRNCERRS